MRLDKIKVVHRFRKDLGKIKELAESIKEVGLLHPIVVRSDTMELIAGRRRFEALKLLNYEEIPDEWVRFVDIKRLAHAVLHKDTIHKDLANLEKLMVLEEIDRELRELEGERSGIAVESSSERGGAGDTQFSAKGADRTGREDDSFFGSPQKHGLACKGGAKTWMVGRNSEVRLHSL